MSLAKRYTAPMEAAFHKRIKGLLTKKDQGYVMGAFREFLRESAHQAGAWMPIADAPRDGTTLLLTQVHDDDGGHGETDHGHWGFLEFSDTDGAPINGWLTFYGRVEEPTHFMYPPRVLAAQPTKENQA